MNIGPINQGIPFEGPMEFDYIFRDMLEGDSCDFLYCSGGGKTWVFISQGIKSGILLAEEIRDQVEDTGDKERF